jgi:hypothetical protein
MEAPRKLARRPEHFAQNLAKNVRLRVGMAVALTVGNADDDHRRTGNSNQQQHPRAPSAPRLGVTTMDTKTITVAVDETTDVVVVETQALELSDAELENVSGGFLDNLAAKCEISGGLNLLSSNVAIELG